MQTKLSYQTTPAALADALLSCDKLNKDLSVSPATDSKVSLTETQVWLVLVTMQRLICIISICCALPVFGFFFFFQKYELIFV